MNPKTKLILYLEWNRFKYKIWVFCFHVIFGRWDRDAQIKIWEYEHPITDLMECKDK